MRLFQRQYSLTLDDFVITALDIAFEVDRSVTHEPNKARVRVWNLNATHRRQLHSLSRSRGPGRIACRLEVGYRGATHVIFQGQLQTAQSTQEGADIVTDVEGQDSGRAYRQSRVSESFPPGTRIDTVVRRLVEALGIGQGNLSEVSGLALSSGVREFADGTVIAGRASDQLTEILRACGYRWSVQNGVLQVLGRARGLRAESVLLTPSTGLIGSPSADVDGKIKIRSLIIPDLYPGRTVRLDAREMQGVYRIEKTKHTGDIAGADWYVDLECEELTVRT